MVCICGWVEWPHDVCVYHPAQVFIMQGVISLVAPDVLGSLGTAASVVASQSTCPACSPQPHCSTPTLCPDCVCQGEGRVCECAECGSWVLALVIGILIGFAVAASLACSLAFCRRRQSSVAPVAQAALPPAEAARAKLAELRVHRHGA